MIHFVRTLNYFTFLHGARALYREQLVLIASLLAIKVGDPNARPGPEEMELFDPCVQDVLDGVGMLCVMTVPDALRIVECIIEDIGYGNYDPTLRS